MPQMAPMNWTFILFLTTTLFSACYAKLYFITPIKANVLAMKPTPEGHYHSVGLLWKW